MSAADLQALLRFLSQEAKVPLALAIGKVKHLQTANLDTAEAISKVNIDAVKAIFPDEKVAKQIWTASKRVSKKRAAGSDDAQQRSAASKKLRGSGRLFSEDAVSPPQLEASLSLPSIKASEDDITKTLLFTNRAPLVLAFAVILLKHTMPAQPLSARLSLAQAVVSANSRSKAVTLGLQSGASAEEEGFGEGQPVIKVMNRDIRVLRRWGYEWKEAQIISDDSTQSTLTGPADVSPAGELNTEDQSLTTPAMESDEPALWALDLEALKTSTGPPIADTHATGAIGSLPIYTAQSARAYLLKSFDTAPNACEAASTRKLSAAAKAAEKERNLGLLLQALDLLYRSWGKVLSAEELDRRAWGWYVKVRPEVEHGVRGWGGKGVVKLSDILHLRRKP